MKDRESRTSPAAKISNTTERLSAKIAKASVSSVPACCRLGDEKPCDCGARTLRRMSTELILCAFVLE